jgi:hypothetical protein
MSLGTDDKKSKKRRTAPNKEGQSSSEDEADEVMEEGEGDDDSDEDEVDGEEMSESNAVEMDTFDFAGFPVKGCDKEMVVKLLNSGALKESNIDAGQLTELFVRNPDLATVLKSTNDEDDEDDMDDESPIAIVGFVHFGVDSNEPGVLQLKSWLQEKMDSLDDAGVKETATKVLNNNSTALLLSARCINLGGGLIVESLRQMKKDLEVGKTYAFKNVLIVLNMYKAMKDNAETENYVFDEEKAFVENSTFQFDFALSNSLQNSMEYIDQASGKRSKGTPFRRVVGLTRTAFNECLDVMALQLSPPDVGN